MPRFLKPGEPLAPQQMQAVLDAFHRDGFALIPGVLTPQEVALIREVTDHYLDSPQLDRSRHNPEGFILRNTLALHPLFIELMMRQPILGLAEAIVGKDCKFVGQNVIRNPPGTAIARWHVDDTVEFPLPPEVPRHDPRLRMPVQWVTIQMALSDIDAIEDGPTQFVPGSHYSGRRPPDAADQSEPTFEGRGPASVFCRAGDIYLQNNQAWHRGAPNTGRRTRYLTQTQYAQRWAFTRFNEYNRVPVPEETLRDAGEPALRVLGLAGAAALSYR